MYSFTALTYGMGRVGSMSFTTRFSLMFHVWFILSGIFGELFAFNVNLDNVQILKDSSGHGNLFGYSAALYTSDDGGIDAMIGAPNRSTIRTEDKYAKGKVVIFKNILNETKRTEEEFYYKNPADYNTDSSDEGFGSTVVAADSSHALVCSPALKDSRNPTYTLTLGRCTLRGHQSNLDINPYFSYNRSDYHTKIDERRYLLNGLATSGFSADIDEKFIVIGAPGVLNFEGSVFGYDLTTNFSFNLMVKVVNNLNNTSYGYIGYSIKLGRFCGKRVSSFCAATGAPGMFNIGQVRLLKRSPRKPKNEQIQVLQRIRGPNMWSRFGHCLGVVNINNNPYDDLLVGAPLYTEWSDPDHVPDQGMVFIYHYSEQSKKYEPENIFLDGSKLPYARFGSALTDIGDINLDGFVDIAVGAPGETDGAGSIYIYLGSTNGFVNVPSQRIQASQISSTLRGFGFAFSNKQVPPNKKYPVFAATSVLSETVVVFTYKSIVDVEATLTATPNPVNTTLPSPCNTTDSRELQETCIQVKFCLRYTIRGETFRAINFSIQLAIDTKIKAVNNKRSMFTTNNNQFMETVKTYLKVGTENEDECSNFEAVLRKAQINKDRFTPIIIVANFSIEPLQNATNDLTLDETKAKNRTLEVTFVKDCGPDAKCEVDLSVNATFTLQPLNTGWTHLVVNLTQEINLKIVIKNKNDPSYGTVAMIELDSYVPFIKAKSDRHCVIGATNTTDISFTTDTLGICCIFYEPLENTGEISFDISFQIDEVDLTRDLKATIEVKPNTPEYNPEMYRADNSYVVEAPLYIVASIGLESSSTPPEHIIYDAKNSSSHAHDEEQSLFNVTHKILIRNNGPSFLPKTEILVEVPMYLFNETQLVTSTDVKMSTPSGEVHCHSNADIDPNFVEMTTLEETDNQDHEEAKRKRRSVDNKNHDRNNNLSKRSVDNKDNGKITSLRCRDNNNLCQLFTCLLNTNLESKSYAEINVTMVLDLSRMYIKEEFKTLQLVSDVIVKEPRHPQFKCWGADQRHETITQFHFMESFSKINIWIIIGSVIGGLVLITIIVIILWKVGFFERTKHWEVQRQKRESMRMAQEVNLIPKSEDEILDSTSTENLDEMFI